MSDITSFDLPSNTVQDSAIPSPDSRRVAYVVNGVNGYHIEIDLKTGEDYELIGGHTFSPDSTKLAYAAKKHQSNWYVVCNNKEIGPYDDIGKTSPVFSPDSNKIAYTALIGKEWFAVLDGEIIGGPYEGFAPGGIVFSPDSSKLTYCVKQNKLWTVVINGEDYMSLHNIIERSLIFSPDSNKIAFIALNPERSFFSSKMKVFAVIDGKKGPLWNYDYQSGRNGILNEIIFSPDSQQVAYAILRNKKWSWIINNEIQQNFESFVSGRSGNPNWANYPDFGKTICRPHSLSFSPDSKHFAYAAIDDNQSVLIYDGKEHGRFSAILNGKIVFSPDSKNIAFAAMEDDQQFIVLNKNPLQRHWGITGEPSFSPDSTLLAYVSIKDDNYQEFQLNIGTRHWIMPGNPFIGGQVVWEDDYMLHTIVFRNTKITKTKYRVR